MSRIRAATRVSQGLTYELSPVSLAAQAGHAHAFRAAITASALYLGADERMDMPIRDEPDELLRAWQQNVARTLLTTMALIALAMLLVFVGALAPAAIVGGVGLVTLLLVCAYWSRVPDSLRSAAVLFAFVYAGTSSLLSSSDPTSAMLYAIGGVIMAELLTRRRVAIVMLSYWILLFALSTWSMHAGVELLPQTSSLDPVLMRLGNSLSLGAVGGLLIYSLSFLVTRLSEALAKNAVALRELERESSERAQALVQLQAAQAQLVRAGKMELLGQLASSIAHDMNNALTVVLAEAEFAAEEAPEASASIQHAVGHASNLTRQLLSMGRRDVVQRRPLDLSHLVKKARTTLRRTLPRAITIELSVDEGVAIEADPNQIQQVLLNLGTNAGHAMPEGGTLRLGLAREGPLARLEIRDEGEGMDEQTQARIFEPFFTTKAVGVGTGLGLASVQAIVLELGGTIECSSKLGQGTSFRIGIPAIDPSRVEPARAEDSSTSLARLDGARVLVADADVQIRALVCATLQQAGAEVTDVAEPDAALALLERAHEPFDLVWTEALTTREPPHSLAAWIAEHSPRTKILVCTGSSPTPATDDELPVAPHTLLAKPFSRRQLLDASHELLDKAS